MNRRLRLLLVEDEPLARASLHRMIEQHPRWEVCGSCGDGEQARGLCLALRPDLLLSDIRVPRLDGIALAASLRLELPALRIVFVTAHDRHAVEAFRLAALDYLLKPVTDAEFAACLARCATDIDRQERLDALSDAAAARIPDSLRPGGGERHLAIRSTGRIDLVPLREVVAFVASGNYVEVITPTRRYLHRQTMAALQAQLDPNAFVRTHRGAIVAVARMRRLQVRGEGLVLELEGAAGVPVAARYRADIERHIAALCAIASPSPAR